MTFQYRQTISDVEPLLSNEKQTAREIWKRLDCWALTSVKQALNELVSGGRAVREDIKTPSGVLALYRRPA